MIEKFSEGGQKLGNEGVMYECCFETSKYFKEIFVLTDCGFMLDSLVLFLERNFKQISKDLTLFSDGIKDEELFDELGRCEDAQEKDAEGGVR